MNKTKIPWCDYTINPVKGICPMHCKDNLGKEYCYAARPNGLYKRFKWNLNKLGLSVKLSFKFLNSFCFSRKDKMMFSIWQSYQILMSIIIPNPIQVMNYPATRQRFPIIFLPNQNMFKNIIIFCSRMFWFINQDVTHRGLPSSPFPIGSPLPFIKWSMFFTMLSRPSYRGIANRTRMLSTCVKSTIIDLLFNFIHHSNYSTFIAKEQSRISLCIIRG